MFKDHFSTQAADYGRFRPDYAPALIDYIAAAAPARTLALDVGCGNGQASLQLATHFELVLASDPSAQQLAGAKAHPHIRYLRHGAECLPVRDRSADLVAVAQAAHWFDLPRFYAEVRRVLRPGGLLALLAYEKFRITPAVDAVVDRFYSAVVGPYWPPERAHIERGYRKLHFPFTESAHPDFATELEWSPEQAVGYVGTWSAVAGYRKARAEDPIPTFARELARVWPAGKRTVVFPNHLRMAVIVPM
jgi:SAM-dependent methyltransferase